MTEFEKWLIENGYAKDDYDIKEIGRKSGLSSLITKPSANPVATGFNPAAHFGPFDAHDTATMAGMAYDSRDRSQTPRGYDRGAEMHLMEFDPKVTINKDEGESANSLEAERNKAKGFLGINKRDDGSTYFTGSEQVRQNLEKTISDYDREIAKLQAEIAMSEAGDPMYDLAVMRMIMNDDMSLMNDIRSRIGKKIDQEFQKKQKKADQEFQHEENELNRENTLDVAKMNKEEQKEAKKKELKDNYESALRNYNWAVQDYRSEQKPEFKRNVEKAKELLRQAASKANMLDDYYRMFGNETNASDKAPIWEDAFDDYEVSGKEGLAEWVKSIKKPKEKARVLRDLKNTYNITEQDLGFSGAEAKLNEKKAADEEALNAQVNAEVGKTFDSGKAATDHLNSLPERVRIKLKAKYDKTSKSTKIVKR